MRRRAHVVRRLALALALVALSACSGDHAAAPTAAPAPPPAEAPAITALPTPPIDTSSPAAEPVVLGRERVAPPPSPEARRAQQVAEAAQENGDHAAARDAWLRTLALAPDFDAAQLALARALSQLGELDGAERALRIALTRDLGRFRSIWLEHPDFAALRSSPRGAAITALVAELDRQWEEAITHGVPLIEWRETPRASVYDPIVDLVTGHSARAALWVEATHRYVLVSPPRASTQWALAEPARRRAIIVEGAIETFDDVGYAISGTRVVVFSLDPSGAELASLTPGMQWSIGLDLDVPDALGVCLASAPDWDDVGRRCVALSGSSATAVRGTAAAADVTVSVLGATAAADASLHLEVSGDRLDTPRGPVTLPPGRVRRPITRVMAATDGARAAVVRCGCPTDDGAPICTVDAVELLAQRATRLAEGVHGVAVAFDGMGAWYVQARRAGRDWYQGPSTVSRFAAPDAPPVDLPAGILLTRVEEGRCWEPSL